MSSQQKNTKIKRLSPETRALLIEKLDDWPDDSFILIDDVLDLVDKTTGYRPKSGMAFLRTTVNRTLLEAFKRARNRTGSDIVRWIGRIKPPEKLQIIEALNTWPKGEPICHDDVISIVETLIGYKYKSSNFLYRDCNKDLLLAYQRARDEAGQIRNQGFLEQPYRDEIVKKLDDWPDDCIIDIKAIIEMIVKLGGPKFKTNSFIYSNANKPILDAYHRSRDRILSAAKVKPEYNVKLSENDRSRLADLIDAWPDDQSITVDGINDLIEINFGYRYKTKAFLHSPPNKILLKAYQNKKSRTVHHNAKQIKLNKKKRKIIAGLIDKWPEGLKITHQDIADLILKTYGITYKKFASTIYAPHMRVIKDAYEKAKKRHRLHELSKSVSTEKTKISFRQLEDITIGKMEAQNKSKAMIKNHISAFRTFVKKGYKRKLTDNIEPSFAGFLHFKETGTQDAKRLWGNLYWKQKKSCVKKFYDDYKRVVLPVEMGNTLASRLKYFALMKDKSILKLMKMIDAEKDHHIVRGWMQPEKNRGQARPTFNTYPLLEKIDAAWGAEGSIIQLIDPAFLKGALKNKRKELGTTEQGMKHRFCESHPYRLPYEQFPDHLKAQVDAYIRFYSDDKAPDGMFRFGKNKWDSQQTIKTAIHRLEYFFGFLSLPNNATNRFYRGMGISKEKLSLVLLTSPKLLEKYMDFRKQRSSYAIDDEGKTVEIGKPYFSNDLVQYLVMGITLLKKGGYLNKADSALLTQLNSNKRDKSFQFPDMYLDQVKALHPDLKADLSWLEYKGYVYDEFDRLLQFKFNQGRDPEAPIQDMMYLEDKKEIITKYIKEALERIWNHLEFWRKADPNFPNIDDLKWARRYMIVAFLFTNPHRREMYRTMRIGKELIKKKGRWHLKFKKEVFKNGKSMIIDHFIPVAGWLQPKINFYLEHYRIHMVGGGETDGKSDCDYFFRPLLINISLRSKGVMTDPVSETLIFTDCRRATMLNINIDGFTGCGPQAFRHLVATSVEAITENIETAASVIGDKIETAKARYVHRNLQEGMLKYNRIQDTVFNTIDADMPGADSQTVHLAELNKLKMQYEKQLEQEKKRSDMLEKNLADERMAKRRELEALEDEYKSIKEQGIQSKNSDQLNQIMDILKKMQLQI